MAVVWRLIDEKPGHQNQSAGLCQALGRIIPTECFDIEVRGRGQHFLNWSVGRFPQGDALPAPDLIVGAGHATHFALLAAKRCYGGRTVVLMNSTLPSSWFDLCVVPEHDGIEGANIFSTMGVLNTVTPSLSETKEQLLILVGGESKHYEWDERGVVDQIAEVIKQSPGVQIKITNSRRSPGSLIISLRDQGWQNVDIVPWQQTPSGWVAEQLSVSRVVWVSEDSVSMVYEALTSGASVGLIQLERRGHGRISAGVDKLIEEGWVMPFSSWQGSEMLNLNLDDFNEAARCAKCIVDQWQLQI